MTSDEQLRRSFDALADRLRDHIEQHATETAEGLAATIQAERAKAAADAAREAWAAAEQEISARLTATLAAAEERARDIGLAEGLEQGRAELSAAEEHAREAGLAAGLEQARAESKAAEERARDAGVVEGLEQARAESKAAEERAREAGLGEGLERARAELDAAATRARETGVTEGLEHARAELTATELAASARLLDAMRAIDRGRSLSEILDTLASCAGREAARVGILLVRENRVRGWRFIGFDAAPDDASALDLPLDEVGVVAEAVRSGSAASHEGGSASSALSFANLPAGREMIALPVSVGGQIVAVLYADQGPNVNVERASWPATLEVLTRHAARALESATAFRAAQMLTARSHATPSASVTGPTGARGDSTLLELGS